MKKNPPTVEEIQNAYESYLKSNFGLISTNSMLHQAQAIENEYLQNELTIAHKTAEALERRIKELENKTTEIVISYMTVRGLQIEVSKTKCCNVNAMKKFNFCPNCGLKIIR